MRLILCNSCLVSRSWIFYAGKMNKGFIESSIIKFERLNIESLSEFKVSPIYLFQVKGMYIRLFQEQNKLTQNLQW